MRSETARDRALPDRITPDRIIALGDGEAAGRGGALFRARLSRRDLALAASVGGLAAALYLATAAPTVTGEDAGELAAASWTLGIAHPPGYPLYMIVAKVFATLLAVGEVAWRLNVLSALLGGVAVGLSALLALRLSAPRWAAAIAALIAAATPALWSQSTITEVYTLSAVLFLCQLHLGILYLLEPSGPRLWALAWTSGVALTAHPGLVLTLPGLSLLVLLRRPALLRRLGELSGAVFFFLLGFSIVLYLPIRSLADPAMDWGNPETLGGLVDHLLRRQYAGFSRPAARPGIDHLLYLGRVALVDVGPLLFLPALCGLGWLMGFPGEGDWPASRPGVRRAFRVAALTLALSLSAGYLPFLSVIFQKQTLALNAVFFIPLILLCVAPAALGLARIESWLESRIEKIAARHPRCRLRPAFALLPLALLVWHFPDEDRSSVTLARDYAEAILETLPPGAVYIPGTDHANFPVVYLQLVEGRRPDVIVADRYGYLDPALLRRIAPSEEEYRRVRGMRRAEAERWLIDRVGRPVLVSSKRTIRQIPPERFEPTGVLYRVDRERRRLSKEEHEALWSSYHFENLTEELEWRGRGCDTAAELVMGDLLFLRAESHFARGEPEAAVAALDRLAVVAAGYREVLQNAGSLLAEKGLIAEAGPFYEAALRLDPGYRECRRNYAWALLSAAVGRREKDTGKEKEEEESGAGAASRAVDLDRGIELAERSIEELPPEPSLVRLLARAYRKKKRFANAREAYHLAARLDESDWESPLESGRIAEEDLHLPELARADYVLSLERRPSQPLLIEKVHGKEARERYEELARTVEERLSKRVSAALESAKGPGP